MRKLPYHSRSSRIIYLLCQYNNIIILYVQNYASRIYRRIQSYPSLFPLNVVRLLLIIYKLACHNLGRYPNTCLVWSMNCMCVVITTQREETCHCSDHECIHVPFTTTSVITQRGQTALMIAASVSHTEVVVELVKATANLDLQDEVCT